MLDLAGLGIKLSSVTQSAAHFDFTGSGFATKTGWITQGEGLLVLDGNPNATARSPRAMPPSRA